MAELDVPQSDRGRAGRRAGGGALAVVLALALCATLVVAALPVAAQAPPTPPSPWTIERVTTGFGGVDSDGESRVPAISADGNHVVFESYATNLGSTPIPWSSGGSILAKDLSTGEVTRVSVASNGSALTNPWDPQVNADGTVVVFTQDVSEANKVVRRDRPAAMTTVVAPIVPVRSPSVDDSGQRIAYLRYTDPDNSDRRQPIFVYDTGAATGTDPANTELPALASASQRATAPVISGDGTTVAYAVDTPTAREVQIVDISDLRAIPPAEVVAGARMPAIDTTGRFVAYVGRDADTGRDQVRVLDRLSGEDRAVVTVPDGSWIGELDLSDDAGTVGAVVESSEGAAVWMTAVDSGRTEVAVTGVTSGATNVLDLGADGRTIAFSSPRGDLVAGDENRSDDVFVAHRSDASGPAWPVGATVAVDDIGSSFASIRWPEADDDIGVTGYQVYVDGSLVAQLAASARTHLITGLAPDTAYAVSIVAVDGEGNPSTSLLDSFTTTSRSTDPGTAALLAVAGPGGSVTLSWDPSDVGGTYQLLRGDAGGGELFPVAEIDASLTSYTDAGLLADTSYRYRIDVDEGGSFRPHTVEVDTTTPSLGTVSTSWRGAGVIGNELTITVAGEPGWQGSADVTYLTWFAEDGSTLDEPRSVTERVLAAEDVTAAGAYRATFAVEEGTAAITAITGLVSDGVGQATAAASRLPLAVRAAAEITVVAADGSLPGARVVMDGVAQSPIEGGAVWPVAAVPTGEQTVRVLAASGRELARTTSTFVAGRTAEVTVTPSIPGSLAVRVLDRDGAAVNGATVTFALADPARTLGSVRTDGLGLAVVPADLDEGDRVQVTVKPPRFLPYVETTSEATVTAAGTVHDVSLVAMASGSLTGVVTLDGTLPAVGAHVVAVQSVDAASRSFSAVTGADGRYVLEGLAGPAEVHVNYRQDPTTSLGTVELAEPATVLDVSLAQAGSYRLQLDLLTRSASDPQWTEAKIDPFTGSSLRAKLVVGDRIQLVQADEVVLRSQPGTTVQFCVDGAAYGLGAGCSEVVLGDAAVVPVELRVESRAAVRATIAGPGGAPLSTTNVSVTISKLVDGRPTPVLSPPVHDFAVDAALAEPGSYQISIHDYSGNGMYHLNRTVGFQVGDGQIADLGTILLARTDWTDYSSVTAVRGLVAPGSPAEIRASLKPSRSGTQEDVVARLVVPAGTEVIEGSVTVDGSVVPFTMEDGVALVELGDRTFGDVSKADAAVVRARLSTAGLEPSSAISVAVEVTSTQSGSTRTQHAGSVLVRIAGVTMSVPSESVSRTVQLSGQAPAGTQVTVQEGNLLVGTATASPAGLWFLTATLPDFGVGFEHVLVASADVDGVQRTSAPGIVVVDERLPVLQRVQLRQVDVVSRIVDIDPMAGVARFPYVWRGQSGAMQVDATFGGRGTVEDVRAEVGARSAPADSLGGGRYVADVAVSANELGAIRLDYDSIPGMATTSDVPVLDASQVESILPPAYADHGTTVIEEDHDEAAGMRRAHLTTTLPSLGDGAEMKTTLSVTRGLSYTPTPQDLADAGRAGVPAYGLTYSVTTTQRSLVISGSAYVPEDQVGASEGIGGGAASVSSAFGVVRIGFQHAFNIGNSAENLLGAATAGGKYDRLQEMSDWVNANCSAANTEFLQGQLDRLAKEALAVDALKAGLMVASVVAAPATFGIGTVGIWATSFFLDKVLDLAFQKQVDTVSRMASETCRDDDEDPRDPRWPDDPNDPNNPDDDGPGGGGRPLAIPTYIHDPSGYVYEAVPSNRVEGVTATLYQSDSPTGPFQLWDADWYGQTNPLVTDGQGAYGWDVPEGFWQVRYAKDGYESASSEVLEVLPPHFDVNVALTSVAAPAVASVEAVPGSDPVIEIGFDRYMELGVVDLVTVTDAAGEPVDGTVEAADAEDGPTGTFARTFRFVPDGGFPTGEDLTVTVDAMATSYAGTPMVAPSTTTAAFADETDIRGVVTGPDGLPLAGATVMAFAETDAWVPSALATTAADGTYAIAGLADGQYRIRFAGGEDSVVEWYDDVADRAAATPVSVTAGSVAEGIDASLAAAASVSGTVTGPDGQPSVGTTVMAFDADDTWFPSASATTAADGTYRLGGLAAGTYRVLFAGSGATVSEWYDDSPTRDAAAPVVVAGGAAVEGIDASLAGAATVTGTVTGPDGQPLGGTRVMAFDADDTWFPSASATTAADGTYRLGGLAAGTYRVVFLGSGATVSEWYDDSPTRGAAAPVTLTGGAAVDGVDASLAAAATVSGTVTGPDGQPLAGTRVMAFDADDTWFPSASATTAADGTYHLGGLAAGTYRVLFAGSATTVGEWYDDSPTRGAAAPVTLTSGSAAEGVDAMLAAAATVSGTVTGSDGRPLQGITAMAFDADDTWFASASATTAADGTYHLGGLAAGTYRLRFVGSGATVDEWYDDSPTRAAADPVVVAVGEAAQARPTVLALV